MFSVDEFLSNRDSYRDDPGLTKEVIQAVKELHDYMHDHDEDYELGEDDENGLLDYFSNEDVRDSTGCCTRDHLFYASGFADKLLHLLALLSE